MKIVAVPIFGTRISSRLDCADNLMLYTTSGLNIQDREKIRLVSNNALDKIQIISSVKPDVIICDGITEMYKNQLEERKISVFEIDRGGDITYHGPGQIIGYAILNLENWKKDTHHYLRSLEEVIIKTCESYGLRAGRNESFTGVWIEDRKICAIGIKVSRWITMHGFAFNINSDLNLFDGIIPCGIQEKSVTSLSVEKNHDIDQKKTADTVEDALGNRTFIVFDRNHGLGKDVLQDRGFCLLQEQLQADLFQSASGRPGASAHKHQ